MSHTASTLELTKARKVHRELPEEDPEFQIAPMVDVLLVLLVFFMSISSTQALQVTNHVVLPISRDGEDFGGVANRAVINVTYAGESSAIEMNQISYAVPEDLLPSLRDLVSRAPHQYSVLIRADKHTQYVYLRRILKTAGEAGVRNISFSATTGDTAQ